MREIRSPCSLRLEPLDILITNDEANMRCSSAVKSNTLQKLEVLRSGVTGAFEVFVFSRHRIVNEFLVMMLHTR